MKGYNQSKCKINTQNQIFRSIKIHSTTETLVQIKKNKTDSQLLNSQKLISKTKNHIQQKQVSNLDLAFMTVTKSDSRYHFSKFLNLEKKKLMFKESLGLLNKINNQNNNKNFQKLQIQQKNNQIKIIINLQVNNKVKFIIKFNKLIVTSILQLRHLKELLGINSSMSNIKKKAKTKKMNLEQFIEKNNELRRHCQTQQEQQYNIFEQLQIQNIHHINLYSSVKRGIKNNVLHNQYKNDIKDFIEIDEELTSQDYDTIKELQQKSIFQNHFSNIHSNKIKELNKQIDENKITVSEQNENKQILIIQNRNNKIKRFFKQNLIKAINLNNVFKKQKQVILKLQINLQYKINIQFMIMIIFNYLCFNMQLLEIILIWQFQFQKIMLRLIVKTFKQYSIILFYQRKMQLMHLYFIIIQSSPWGNSKNNYDKYLEFLDPNVRDLYKRAKTIHLRMQILKASHREQYWSLQKLIFIYK
ncbi:unnamed protein product [Paramecium primaurelia]|uniref:Transmembrane protein n=1 Tax=Paramecium primaurelia TaxID=5886 RepID=A0A8S1MC07_PARPR|nr:unnamed protein product [Paramecium primaurelia]